jgi:hypothetical protein
VSETAATMRLPAMTCAARRTPRTSTCGDRSLTGLPRGTSAFRLEPPLEGSCCYR